MFVCDDDINGKKQFLALRQMPQKWNFSQLFKVPFRLLTNDSRKFSDINFWDISQNAFSPSHITRQQNVYKIIINCLGRKHVESIFHFAPSWNTWNCLKFSFFMEKSFSLVFYVCRKDLSSLALYVGSRQFSNFSGNWGRSDCISKTPKNCRQKKNQQKRVQCGMKLHSVLICLHKAEHFIIFPTLHSTHSTPLVNNKFPVQHSKTGRKFFFLQLFAFFAFSSLAQGTLNCFSGWKIFSICSLSLLLLTCVRVSGKEFSFIFISTKQRRIIIFIKFTAPTEKKSLEMCVKSSLEFLFLFTILSTLLFYISLSINLKKDGKVKNSHLRFNPFHTHQLHFFEWSFTQIYSALKDSHFSYCFSHVFHFHLRSHGMEGDEETGN